MAYKQKVFDTPNLYWFRTWYTQPKPYSRPLNFLSQRTKLRPGADYTANAGNRQMYFESAPLYIKESIKTAAYEKFRSGLGEAALVAVNYAERKRTLENLQTRVKGSTLTLLNLRHKKWQALKRAAKRNLGNWNKTFLEFHFGWIPLVKDVFTAVRAILQPPKDVYLRGSATGNWDLLTNNGGSWRDYRATLGVRIRGAVVMVNPNLVLFNQLGLLNPASYAWERLPFSFVLDWFANVNSFLSQFTDFAGIDTSRVSWTAHLRGTTREWIYNGSRTYDGPSVESFEVTRRAGIPFLLPTVKPFQGFSVLRGVTAIALLLNKSNPFRSIFK